MEQGRGFGFAGQWGLLLAALMAAPLASAVDDAASAGQNSSAADPGVLLQRSTTELDTLFNRPHRSLTAMASQRMDFLARKELWTIKPNLTLHKLLDLPVWASLAVEERVRYENYSTPWINGNVRGQWSVPMQTVVFGEVRPTDNLRFSAEFWDARQWGPQDPNKITAAMVNTLNFSQIYMAAIERGILDSAIDAELKLGQMTMLLGSSRLISRYSFRNTQQSYVGVQSRLRENQGQWELLTFANVPEELLPQSTSGLLSNSAVWNRPMSDAYFAGYFLTHKLGPQDHLESYFYSLARGLDGTGHQEVQTPGVRLYREVQKSGMDYEIESVGQSGLYRLTSSSSANSHSTSSIMEHIQIAHSWDVPFKPRIQLEWDYASPYFNPLFGQSVFDFGPSGIAGFFGRRNNINSPGARFLFNPDAEIFAYVVYRQWWLANARAPTGWGEANLVDPSGGAGSHIGQSVELAARWDLVYNLAFQAGWQVLMKGRFAEMAPGAPSDHSPVNYFYVETEVRL